MKNHLEIADQFEIEKLEERTEFYFGHHYNHHNGCEPNPLDEIITA